MPADSTDLQFTDDMLDSASFLDKLASAEAGDPPKPAPEDPEEIEPLVTPETPPVAPVVPPTAPVVPPAAPVEPPVTPVVPPAEPPPFVDPYPDVKLSPHARASTGEQFTQLKMRAQRDLQERDTELARIKAEVEELRTKATAEPITDEVRTELNTLRAFRESVAVEGDPVFVRKYEAPIQKVDEALFERLKTGGLADDTIAKIKEIGVGQLDWAPVLASLPSLKPFIERKLQERDGLDERKREAIKAVRTNYEAAVAERREAVTLRQQEEAEESTKAYEQFLPTVPQLKVTAIPIGATPEERARLTAANKAVQDALALGKGLLNVSNSPSGRAEAATVAALAHVFKVEAAGARAAFTQEETAHRTTRAELDKLRATLKTTQDELAKLRGAGRTVLDKPLTQGGGAPANTGPGLLASSQEALDYYARNA